MWTEIKSLKTVKLNFKYIHNVNISYAMPELDINSRSSNHYKLLKQKIYTKHKLLQSWNITINLDYYFSFCFHFLNIRKLYIIDRCTVPKWSYHLIIKTTQFIIKLFWASIIQGRLLTCKVMNSSLELETDRNNPHQL